MARGGADGPTRVQARHPQPAGAARAAPEEWRSEDLAERLRDALQWGGMAERLKRAGSPTAAEILEELGMCWSNAAHIAKHADGYRVRGGKAPAFWMGQDTTRRPTLETQALVDRVRRVLELPITAIPSSPPAAGRPSGAERRKRSRARKGAADGG